MFAESTIFASLALLASSALVGAQGSAEPAEGYIMYNSTSSTKVTTNTITYTALNTKLTLNNTYAVSVWVGGGNEAWGAGTTCLVDSTASSPNYPGGVQTIVTGGEPAVLTAGSDVLLNWVCCGDCAAFNGTGATGSSASSSTTATTLSRATKTAATVTVVTGSLTVVATASGASGGRGNAAAAASATSALSTTAPSTNGGGFLAAGAREMTVMLLLGAFGLLV